VNDLVEFVNVDKMEHFWPVQKFRSFHAVSSDSKTPYVREKSCFVSMREMKTWPGPGNIFRPFDHQTMGLIPGTGTMNR
jgi:hypothetical protein